MKKQPRYKPSWTTGSGEAFADHANELDVWVEHPNDWNCFERSRVFVVAPQHLILEDPENTGNFDAYESFGQNLIPVGTTDVLTTPHDMILIYKIAIKQGVLK